MKIFSKSARDLFPKIMSKTLYKNHSQHNLRESGFLNSVVKGATILGTTVVFAYLLGLQKQRSRSIQPALVNHKPSSTTVFEPVNKKRAKKETKAKQMESIRHKYNFIDKIVKRCVPAVFYLEIRDPSRIDPETGKPLVTSNGSGFIISEDGHALSNAHVVVNKTNSIITAVMPDGSAYDVRVEDADLNVDIALLKLQTDTPTVFPKMNFAEPGDTTVGEWVVALGSPLSLNNSVTVGVVSNVDRKAEELGLRNYSMSYIQTDASITFGNSGGPLVNLDGNVIGINNLRLTSGISFAIPVAYVQRFLQNNQRAKETRAQMDLVGRKLFGLTTIAITSELINDMLRKIGIVPNEITQGLLVWKVLSDTPAERSGLKVGDIITHINGIPIREAGDMYAISGKQKEITVGVYTQGQRREIMLRNFEDGTAK